MSNSIHIEEPCHQDINRMATCGKNFFCASCSKEVIDLRHFTKPAAETFVKENKNICAVVHTRHIKSKKRYTVINSIEAFWLRLKLKRVAIACSVMLLFIAGCHSRRKSHRLAGAVQPMKTPDIIEQIHSDK